MTYDIRIQYHEIAATREEDAATRASCETTAGLHAVLARMHANEAARIGAVMQTLRMAFGD